MRRLNSSVRVKYMNTEVTKQQLQELVDRVNSTPQRNTLEFHQQTESKENMSITGGNGRLCIRLTTKGYDIGLSGKSLEKEMYAFMCKLTSKNHHDKYGFPAKEAQPKWEVDNFKKVEDAVCRYASTIK